MKNQAELYVEATKAAKELADAGKTAEARAITEKTAMAGLLSIVGSCGDEYEEMSKAIYDASGTAARAAGKMGDSLQDDMSQLKKASCRLL